jgi:hypothetical protein
MQKTFHGQTAGGLLKTATVVKMRSGNYEIIIDDKRGHEYIAILTDYYSHSLLIMDCGVIAAELPLSYTALRRARELTKEAEYKPYHDMGFYN